MELVKRTTLHFREGNSDKVYEVDLCRVGEDRYLINFRYGRRGSHLKEGTKTTQPIPFMQAHKTFDKLIGEKTKKGYRDVSNTSAPASAPAAAIVTVSTTSNDPRHQAILNRLANKNESKWKLERVIWRAGELKIKEATPYLIALIGSGTPMRDYCIAWALGWCGNNDTIPVLYKQFYENPATPEFIKRIAWEAIFKLSDEANKEVLRTQKIRELPTQLQELVINGDADSLSQSLSEYLKQQIPINESIQAIENQLLQLRPWDWRNNEKLQNQIKSQLRKLIPELQKITQRNFSDYYQGYYEIYNALNEYINHEKVKHYVIIDVFYQIDNIYTRPIILNLIKTVPLSRPYFKRFRHIFKMAEYRHDAEVFSIFAYRFDREKGYSRSSQAYQKNTRDYLQRRVWRTLKQLGEEKDPDYINLSTEILLQYNDADAKTPKSVSFSRWNSQTRSEERGINLWDAYASYLIFNHILYENSPRYLPHPKAWRCQDEYLPEDPPPAVREEAFPKLWQQHPEALLRLLLESHCHRVHQFAVKALRDCRKFCDRISLNNLIQLLDRPYLETLKFAFNLIRDRYNPSQPNVEVILALVNSNLNGARKQGYIWIEEQREYFLNADSFLVSLVTSPQQDTRAFAKRLLSASILDENTTRVLIGQIIANLLAFSEEKGQTAREIGEILLESFTPQLRSLGLSVILDLLNHPLPEVKEIGARILLNHQTPAADLPPNLIGSLIASPYETIRGIGVRIFGQLPDERLMSDRVLIIAMAMNAIPDIRSAIRPVICRLTNNRPDFSRELAIAFIDLLLTREQNEGVHRDLITVLKEDIPDWMSVITKEKTTELLRAKSTIVQELAGLILQENYSRFLEDFATHEIVKLASHEILAVREAARNMFSQRLETIRGNLEEMLSAVRLLEAKWQDSKQFAIQTFNNLPSQEWTPELIVCVCDSVYEDVRNFGRDLVIKHFSENYGQEYLLKFSEHPSSDMQIFATNYLENHAADNCDRLLELTPYFITVLSRVNKGRVAKQRIFNFLDTEAQKSETAAKIVAEILTRQSVTMAIGDKASAIQIMLKIKKKYPHIATPIQIIPVPSR